MRKRQRLMVAGALVLGLVLGAAALAVAGNGGVIYACVNNDSGTVKIVDADTVCNENWTLTTWNQEGAPGADGADGQDGADGADGQDGADGADGQDGEDGADGQDGEDGFDGQDGADGADGTPGGLSGLERVTGTAFGAVAEGETISATAVCPAGKSVTGGGFTTSDPRLRIFESATTVAVAQWTVNWVATVDVPNAVVVAEAICAHSAP
jgi:hypothetical protein